MAVSAQGTARIRHRQTGVIYEISSDELDWSELVADGREMGMEVGYLAQIDHPQLGPMTWEVWEYPAGVENDRSANLGGHVLLENFSISLDGNNDEDDLTASVQGLVEWFGKHYEDPAHETPYNGREGGYQYVWGGPYDARTELYDNFGATVPEKVIEAAVEEIESDGTLEWAPGRLHQDQKRREDDYYKSLEPELEDLVDLVKEGREQTFGRPGEVEARGVLAVRVDELELILGRLRAGMGHNRPPEPIGDTAQLALPDINALEDHAVAIRRGLENSPPDARAVGEQALALKQGWLGQKLNKMADGAFEEFGKELGKWGARAVVATTTINLSPALSHAIHALIQAALHWLAVVLNIAQ